jgi:hypothetical protein
VGPPVEVPASAVAVPESAVVVPVPESVGQPTIAFAASWLWSRGALHADPMTATLKQATANAIETSEPKGEAVSDEHCVRIRMSKPLPAVMPFAGSRHGPAMDSWNRQMCLFDQSNCQNDARSHGA